MNYVISPSILSADFRRLEDQIRQAESAGVDWIHIDVMDGRFVPNISMGPFIVETCRRITQLPLDVHLMIVEPEKHIQAFAQAGADLLTVHTEVSPHLYKTLQSIHDLGCKAGVALNPGTPASFIQPVMHLADLVLVMMVNPGFSGQKFENPVLPKIREVRAMFDAVDNPNGWVEVDGGIDANTLPLTLNAGANAFVAATAIFKYPHGIADGVRALRAQIPG